MQLYVCLSQCGVPCNLCFHVPVTFVLFTFSVHSVVSLVSHLWTCFSFVAKKLSLK